MKIKQNTSSLLIADDTPWALGIVLVLFTLVFVGVGLFTVFRGQWLGLIFVFVGGGMGLGAMAFFVEKLQLILDAQARTVTIRSRTMIRYRQTVLPLSGISKAIVEDTHSRSNRKNKLWRPSLVVMDDGGTYVRPITDIFTGGNGAKTIVPVINQWLENHRSY